MRTWKGRGFLSAVSLFVSVGALVVPAFAQGPAWYTFDSSPPGTPADVQFDQTSSDPTTSFFDVFIHGFWYMTRTGYQGQQFLEMKFPGLATFALPGEPQLPAVQLPLALPPGVQLADLAQVEVLSSQRLFPPNLCWPAPFEELDHPGTPERAAEPSPSIYNGQVPWPTGNADASRQMARRMGGVVNGTQFRLQPVHFNPVDRSIDVQTHVRYKVSHPGGTSSPGPITKDSWAAANALFLNWAIVNAFYTPNTEFWTGHYLVVTESQYWTELMPLVNQKLARGYAVTVHLLTAAEIGSAPNIRSAIKSWYDGTPSWYDHYALLVGDTSVIPLGSKSGTPTDDLYGDVDGDGTDDLDEEVWVGRLSADDDADVSNQVSKWLAYMDAPNPFFDYGRDLLVGNKELAPGKYVGCLETVRTYGGYTVPPSFTTLYGHIAGNNNADITALVNSGFGILTYRGHGDTNEWWNWDLPGESFLNAQVDALANGIAPVVWSFACTNFDLGAEDCFAEHWMERSGSKGGVSFYGATIPSGTGANHVLARAIHRAVFRHGLTKQGRAIEWSEAAMWDSTSSNNAWMYGLLGDPDMDVRRKASFSFTISLPGWPWKAGQATAATSFQVKVEGAQGQPIGGALVGAYKPSPTAAKIEAGTVNLAVTSEVFDNAYADRNGLVTLDGIPSEGWLYLAVRLDDGSEQGNALFDSVYVQNPTDALPFDAPLTLRAFPNVTRGQTRLAFGRPLESPVTVNVYDVAGRRVRALAAPRSAVSVAWDGRRETGETVASGVYYARLTWAGRTLTARIVVTK